MWYNAIDALSDALHFKLPALESFDSQEEKCYRGMDAILKAASDESPDGMDISALLRALGNITGKILYLPKVKPVLLTARLEVELASDPSLLVREAGP